MELIVSIVILSAVLLVIIGLIPAGVTGLRKADDVQAATLYGMEVVEETCKGNGKPDVTEAVFKVRLNQSTFEVHREVSAVDRNADPPSLFDVAVTVSWAGQPAPVKLRTRIYRP